MSKSKNTYPEHKHVVLKYILKLQKSETHY